MEGHRSCVWGEGGLGPVDRKKVQQRHWTFPGGPRAERTWGGGEFGCNLDETIDLFACTFRSSTSKDISAALKEIISLDLSSRTIRRYLKNTGKFQYCKITERQGVWNPLKWTRLANNLEWTGVSIVHSCICFSRCHDMTGTRYYDVSW